MADSDGGMVDDGVVTTYFEGRAEVRGWVVADRAVEGRTADALEQLRWALETGTDPVLVTAALATAVRLLARLSGVPRGVRDADVARDLEVPPWKVRMLRGQLRGWTPTGLVRAVRAVAAADLAVKGGGNDPTLALTTALLEIGAARNVPRSLMAKPGAGVSPCRWEGGVGECHSFGWCLVFKGKDHAEGKIMRVFVAGATGALGRHLVPGLVAAGHEVTATTRTPGKVAQLRRRARSRWSSTGWIARR